MTTIRADKLLSSLGLVSRRGVEKFIKQNTVTADGEKILLHGQRISKHAEIKVNGRMLRKPKKVYFLLNKPKGVVSTASDEFGRKNVVSLIKTSERIFPVGRLDRNTHGLLLLTNDGELTNKLIHPKFHIGKTYKLKIKGLVEKEKLENLEKGVELDDGKTQPANVKLLQSGKSGTVIEVTIFEGKKRQIRRMCEALNLNLIDLQRVRFGNLILGNLKAGESRMASHSDIESLKKLISKQP